MKNEATNLGSKLAIARRQPGANWLPEDYVRRVLTDAGYGALPLGDRGLLYDALSLVMKDDPESFAGLVDELRGVLERDDELDRQAELKRLALRFKILKGCPECDQKPDLECGHEASGLPAVVCFNHERYAVGRTGQTIDDAITRWNRDDWIDPGLTRTAFAFA